MKSKLEEKLSMQLTANGINGFVREHRFLAKRKFRLDFAWPDRKLGIEVHGGTYSGGRHTQGSGFERDCTKRNYWTLKGWRVLEFTATPIRKGTAIDWVKELLKETH